MSLIVDVGANVGDFSIPCALANPLSTVLIFEPIPELRTAIEAKAQALNIENLVIRSEAIGISEGFRDLHISTSGEMGVSSLRTFNQNNVLHNDYWKSREDLVHQYKIRVRVTRLDSVVRELGFSTIDFLKIDAQGEDLNVLQSASNTSVRAGMLEAPTTVHTALYEDEPDLFQVLQKLENWRFRTYRIKPNDPANAEVNVFFCQQDVNHSELENALALKSNPIYSGKDYWWMPSCDNTNPIVATANLEGKIVEMQNSIELKSKNLESLNQVVDNLRLQLKEVGQALDEEQLIRLETERSLEKFKTSINGRIYTFLLSLRKNTSDVL